MARDFMGLAVKQEIPDEIIDAAPVRSLPMQWPFSNKGSALPQLLSFQGSPKDKPKTGFHSLTSTGVVSITTEAFESDHKSYPPALKSMAPDKQSGVRYTVLTYPSPHIDANAIRCAATARTNLAVSPAVTTSVHQPLISSLRGVPMSVPSGSAVVGTTDLRSSSKISNSPSQLTIFYNGSVCVYNSVSPEKAQAIMLLAGNGPPTTSTATSPTAPVPRPSAIDGFAVSQPYISKPHRLSPVPVAPVTVPQSAGRSKNDVITASSSPIIAAEPLKAVSPLGSVSVNFLSSGTVPQFRRKSLARFLEKRKERVITASPYAPDISSAVNPSGSCPFSPTN